MQDQLPTLLSLLRSGPKDAPSLCQQLGISQPTLSRRITEAGNDIVRIGRARSVRYLALREVARQARFTLYRVTPAGQVEKWGELLPVHPGFMLRQPNEPDQWLEGLPWWLQDMRPQGFLGRLWVQHRAAALGLPQDLLSWNDDHVITALAAGEQDVPGNLLIGDLSRSAWLAYLPTDISTQDRIHHYPRLAAQAIAGELVGSSAGGEQPKFTAQVGGIAVIVKFSAAQDNTVSRRWRDLLLAEHLALQVLASHGIPAAESELLDIGSQRFLQLRRFDRTEQGGRRGVVSLAALDGEFLGLSSSNWPQYTEVLVKQGQITEQAHQDTCRLYAFGRLIGNGDMHNGNLAFLHEGSLPLSLAPAYDMLPMSFSPDRSGAMRYNLPPFQLPTQPTAGIWREMLPLAHEYWLQLAKHPLTSPEFSRIAREQETVLDSIGSQLAKLA
ncbi:type II toxin-antitoxin system HipA family toxin YjjJ [Chitinimonas sp. PSY-7]|uniref:type II toxin-antitoxin system HipA family toxin YjjJ n=1 Tax=Chitinimonas sp. PSY-7 TaxID=3459088 RepID=UPI00403FF5AA